VGWENDFLERVKAMTHKEMLQEQAYLVSDRMWTLLDFIKALDVEVEKTRDEFQKLIKEDPCMKLRRSPKKTVRWFRTLVDFTIFCSRNPELRFWQALRTWVRADFIFVSEKSSMEFQEHEQGWLDDTFYREGK
jgi:hypothetical protein